MRAWLETLVTLAIAALLAIMATTPPAPRKANSSPAPFDLARAEIDLRTIARAPHPTGSVENGHVRDYLLAGMKAIGMETATREGVLDEKAAKRLNKWSGRSDPPARTVNLIGVLPGRDRAGPAVLLMAHHDSVWGSPAASDDGADQNLFDLCRASLRVFRNAFDGCHATFPMIGICQTLQIVAFVANHTAAASASCSFLTGHPN